MKNLIASVDFETTGLTAGYHEPIEVAVVTHEREYHTYMRPDHPERHTHDAQQVHRIPPATLIRSPSQTIAADRLLCWWRDYFEPQKLFLLAHNAQFEANFLHDWLGPMRPRIFHNSILDTKGEACAQRLPGGHALAALCDRFAIRNNRPHCALYDARATLEVWSKLRA